MKGVVKYVIVISIICILCVFTLQLYLLRNTYKALSVGLYVNIDECFSTSVENELLKRVDRVHPPEGTIIVEPRQEKDSTSFQKDLYIGFNDFCERFHHPRNTDSLNKYFITELNGRNINNLKFRIRLLKTDTSYYRSPADFHNDTSFKKITFNEFKTHIVPVKLNLSEGIQAVIVNPYKIILTRMWLLLLASFFIIVFVIFCIAKLVTLLHRITAISRMRQDHTYGMIHDMNGPLANIVMASDDLENLPSVISDYDAKRDVEILEDESNHLIRISKQILTVAKLESKKLIMNKTSIGLQILFEEIKRKYISHQGKRPDIEIIKSNAYVLADKDYLIEILDNLIENSIKYSKDKVTIKLSSFSVGKYTEIRLLDNGIGIEEKKKERLFEKFERGVNAKEIEGHGIGLNYVYQLMKAMGGYVKINSEKEKYTEVILGFLCKK